MSSNLYKVCTKCRVEKTNSLEFFSEDKYMSGVLRNKCRQCRNEERLIRKYGYLPEKKRIAMEGYKICPECGEEKKLDLDNFYKNSGSKTGFQSWCKICVERRTWIKKYGNDDLFRVKVKDGYKICKGNCGKELEANRDNFAYKNDGKNKLDSICKICDSERGIKYREENIEKEKDRKKKYRSTESGRIASSNGYHRRRVKERKILKETGRISLEEWENCKAYFENKCCYCEIEKKLEKEHFIAIDKGGGHNKENILPACRSCNASKLNKNFEEWYKKFKFYDVERKFKIENYLS